MTPEKFDIIKTLAVILIFFASVNVALFYYFKNHPEQEKIKPVVGVIFSIVIAVIALAILFI